MNPPMKVFTFEVAHPSLDPPTGAVIELEAPSYTDAIKAIAAACPGVHIVRLVHEYWKHEEGGTA